MKIIYHCYDGAYASVIAAGIHMGELPVQPKPSISQIVQLPHFGEINREKLGDIVFMGKDIKGNHIYTLGRKNKVRIMGNLMKGLSDIFNLEGEEILYINTANRPNFWLRAGSFLSFWLHLNFIGKYLGAYGVSAEYSHFVHLVENYK